MTPLAQPQYAPPLRVGGKGRQEERIAQRWRSQGLANDHGSLGHGRAHASGIGRRTEDEPAHGEFHENCAWNRAVHARREVHEDEVHEEEVHEQEHEEASETTHEGAEGYASRSSPGLPWRNADEEFLREVRSETHAQARARRSCHGHVHDREAVHAHGGEMTGRTSSETAAVDERTEGTTVGRTVMELEAPMAASEVDRRSTPNRTAKANARTVAIQLKSWCRHASTAMPGTLPLRH